MQPARHSKLEKADILEMTVKHLQTIQRQQLAVSVTTDPQVLHKFKSGFSECATEVNRYINNMDGVETGVKQRLVAHLSGCVTGLQQSAPTYSFSTSNGNIPLTISQGSSGVSIQTGFNGDNNNNRIQVPAGIQLIPSRLPTGELALLVPNSSNMPFFSPSVLGGAFQDTNQTNRSNSSAFTSVRPSRNPESHKMSPPLSPASSTTSYEDHHDNFPRPRTPSPREVTISFPTPPHGAFKNNFQEQSPPQQFHVTSTSVSPENKPLKIEYKSVPIYQPNEPKPSYRVPKSMEPLSVDTDRFKSDDESLYRKKRPYPVDEGLLTVASFECQPSTSKYARFDDVSSSASSSGSPDRFSEYNANKPEGSGNDASNDSMWRPW